MQALTCLLSVAIVIGQAQAPSKPRAPGKAKAVLVATPELKIDSGALRGLVLGDNKDIHAYKGIPYAVPPVGDLRWKPPQPAAAWQGVRDCFDFGAACPQKIPPLFGNIPEMALRVPMNEDCLFLNVWTPAERKGEKLPVLYWIHGGGYIVGAGSQPLYDGEELARLGCVVVSVNYRLGLFGFLAHPALSQESAEKVSGNYGLLDQIEGLRWVKRNIAAFGGDAEHVAIFGESAGGGSVLCLMVAPQAKGLFQAAVAQSSPGMNMLRLHDADKGQETAEHFGEGLISACGLKGSADAGQMRHLDAKSLANFTPMEGAGAGGLRLKPLSLKLGPIVDGHVIPDSPNPLFASGHEHAVPLIVGNTKDEMSLMLLTAKFPSDMASYQKKMKDDFGDQAEAVEKAYPVNDPSQIRPAIVQLTTDLSFVSETRLIARTHSAAGQKAYRYQFSRGTSRGFLKTLGAHHGSEVGYVFQLPTAKTDESGRRISQDMGRYWINLAAAGNPNSQGLPNWPAYAANSEEMVDFGQDVTILKGPRNEQLDLIERILHGPADASNKRASN
jgi:para-nitrobenzyl esterase